MKRSKAEFHIHSAFREGDALVVDGRVLDSALSVGDVFRHVYRLEPDRDLRDQPVNFMVIEPRSLNLRIDQILAYRKSFPTMDSGGTARLFLTGTGAELVGQGDVLGV
jgi:hypothetical protein